MVKESPWRVRPTHFVVRNIKYYFNCDFQAYKFNSVNEHRIHSFNWCQLKSSHSVFFSKTELIIVMIDVSFYFSLQYPRKYNYEICILKYILGESSDLANLPIS